MEDKTKILATREDISILKGELKIEIEELKTEMAKTKSDIIKWMFIFWIGQVAATFGFILLYLNK